MNDRLVRNALTLQAAIVRAHIRALGMQAENMQREHRGQSMAYGIEAFERVIGEEAIGVNYVIEMLRD